MTRPTILHEAELELWEAVAYYEERCSGLGLDFEREVKSAVELIARYPEGWPLRDDGTRRFLLHRFPYVVVYTIHQDRVWIVAIAHCKREPGYWTRRLRRG